MEINELINFYLEKNKKIEELWRVLWSRQSRKKNPRIRKYYE